MMKRKNASFASKLRILAAIPVLVVLIFVFSCKNESAEIKTIENSKNTENVQNQAPQFPGGQAEMMKFIFTNIKYPEQAKKEGIAGTVYVQFNISKEGKVRDVKIVKGVNSLLDAEAVRVVSAMPDWLPGNSAFDFSIPIKFALQ